MAGGGGREVALGAGDALDGRKGNRCGAGRIWMDGSVRFGSVLENISLPGLGSRGIPAALALSGSLRTSIGDGQPRPLKGLPTFFAQSYTSYIETS